MGLIHRIVTFEMGLLLFDELEDGMNLLLR
jgi:hypothetical protein